MHIMISPAKKMTIDTDSFAVEALPQFLAALLPAPLYEKLSPYIVSAPNPTQGGEEIPGGIELSRSHTFSCSVSSQVVEPQQYLLQDRGVQLIENICNFVASAKRP